MQSGEALDNYCQIIAIKALIFQTVYSISVVIYQNKLNHIDPSKSLRNDSSPNPTSANSCAYSFVTLRVNGLPFAG